MPTTYAIPDGRTVMAATLYTGNGGTVSISNAVNGVFFQPDFVWIKNRAAAVNHQLQNSNAGWQYGLNSNNTNAEYTDATAITGSTSSGWSMNNNYNSHNQSGVSYVGWNWKGGGTAVSNTAGTITSSVSANTTAGFSVVTYTGNGTSGATVGHGLGVTPSMVILKRRDVLSNWQVKHTSLNANQNLELNSTTAVDTAPGSGYISAISSTTLTLLNGGSAITNVNTSGSTYVAYCFAAVAGYSAFGSYTGNNSNDGPFVYLGFRPRFVMFKDSSTTGAWMIMDSSMNAYNVGQDGLAPNNSNSTYAGTPQVDFLSNGFKIRANNANAYWNNVSGNTYIYAAFAESPFKTSLAR